MDNPGDNVKKTLRVLVVDDEAPICQSVRRVLGRRGHEVEQSLCVSGALESLQAGKRFDLIIADLMMPQAGGAELLRATRDRWADIPVLIITGYASVASAVETTRLGAAGYLPKPFTPDELEKAVESVVLRGPWTAPEPRTDDVIDVDMPFSEREVETATSAKYVEHLTRSDMPVVAQPPAPAADFCSLGQRSCKKFAKSGICKKGLCAIDEAERRKAGRAQSITAHVFDPIDVDMPFSASEVASLTSQAYVAALGRSDMPVVGHWGEILPSADARRVLVVDDEPVVLNSMRKTLSRKGFSVDEAFSCSEAMDRIRDGKHHLVLLDMKMSDGNGLDLLPKIRALRPGLPVVIVTGYASIDTALEAIRRGASDYMAKPFTPDELCALTSRVLEARGA